MFDAGGESDHSRLTKILDSKVGYRRDVAIPEAEEVEKMIYGPMTDVKATPPSA
jgi:hypothetical protein